MAMRIEARDHDRRHIGRIDVDASSRPTRVALTPSSGARYPRAAEREQRRDDGGGRAGDGAAEIFLTWDSALDDAGHLRRCVVCGCSDLFQEKVFPQVTAVIVVLAFIGAFAGAFTGIFGREFNLPLMIALVIVLLLDVGVLVFARRRLVCYRCRSSFHKIPIARYHKTWDRAIADRYRKDEGGSQSRSEPRGDGSSRWRERVPFSWVSRSKEGSVGG